jgi:ATP-dependent Clp protease ATP-binding subunit ClpC
MAIGPTGCGKTLIAKTLAKEIFGDEKYLVRFDMSEYSDETSVNKLIGSSAGYVGYTEGGLLTEAIKRNKYCVLLIDEIEKAHDKVYNLFLQILDEGFLTDNTGYKVDFRNTIIIMTSNVGAKRAANSRGIGFTTDDIQVKEDVLKKELKNQFPPEFLNRFDDIVYFNALSDDNLKDIIRLELSYLNKRMNKIGYSLSYEDDTIVDALFKEIEEEKEYGARPIHRVIRNKIENKITDLLIDNDYQMDYQFKVIVNEKRDVPGIVMSLFFFICSQQMTLTICLIRTGFP